MGVWVMVSYSARVMVLVLVLVLVSFYGDWLKEKGGGSLQRYNFSLW